MAGGKGVGRGSADGRSPRERPARRRRDERGITLLEITITVVVLGLIGVAFGSSMFLVTYTSARQDTEAFVQTELNELAEYVRSRPYVSCADPEAYDPHVQEPGYADAEGVTTEIVSIGYWAPPSDPSSWPVEPTWDAAPASCTPGPDQHDPGVQRILLRAQHADVSPIDMYVVKRP